MWEIDENDSRDNSNCNTSEVNSNVDSNEITDNEKVDFVAENTSSEQSQIINDALKDTTDYCDTKDSVDKAKYLNIETLVHAQFHLDNCLSKNLC